MLPSVRRKTQRGEATLAHLLNSNPPAFGNGGETTLVCSGNNWPAGDVYEPTRGIYYDESGISTRQTERVRLCPWIRKYKIFGGISDCSVRR